MRIGIDFDNTIVCYDGLFHQAALDEGLIPPDLPLNKIAVRDHLRAIGREDDWTALQGQVYGARMAEAEAFPGVKEVLEWAAQAGATLFIISHKTRHPFRGPSYDLHRAARAWIGKALCEDGVPLISPDRVFFELTKEEKLARIAACACDFFIDDLPEILLAPGFPAAIEGILFDPEGHHPDLSLPVVSSWCALRDHLEVRAAA